MCAEDLRSFEHFIGIEEENIITSIANLGPYYVYIHELCRLLMGFFPVLVTYWRTLFKDIAGDKKDEITRAMTKYSEELNKFLKAYPFKI